MNVTKPISWELSRLTDIHGNGELRTSYFELVSVDGYNQIVRNFYTPLWRRQYQQLFRQILIELEIYEK